MIQLTGVTKIYNKRTVVDSLSIQVKQKEAYALLGSNGAGKSTTIKMILGLVKTDGGIIEVPNGQTIGYSPETPYFPAFLSGEEVIIYYAKLQHIPKNEIKDTADRLLFMVGLENDRTKVKYYSKGMLQRLALAQALIGDPDILILDEPCAGLDAMGRIEMIELIKRFKNQGKTILINSHILSDIEKVCDRGVIMDRGKIIREWAASDLKDGNTLERIFTEAVGGVR